MTPIDHRLVKVDVEAELSVLVLGPGAGGFPARTPGVATRVLRAGEDRVHEFRCKMARPEGGRATVVVRVLATPPSGDAVPRLLLAAADAAVFVPDRDDVGGLRNRRAFRRLVEALGSPSRGALLFVAVDAGNAAAYRFDPRRFVRIAGVATDAESAGRSAAAMLVAEGVRRGASSTTPAEDAGSERFDRYLAVALVIAFAAALTAAFG